MPALFLDRWLGLYWHNRPQKIQRASRKPFATSLSTRAHRSGARELDMGRVHITPLLKVVREQPANQQPRYQPMAATKPRCPSGDRVCTRAKGKRDTTHISALSSARTLRE